MAVDKTQNKKDESIEEIAERLAEIFVLQIELKNKNKKATTNKNGKNI